MPGETPGRETGCRLIIKSSGFLSSQPLLHSLLITFPLLHFYTPDMQKFKESSRLLFDKHCWMFPVVLGRAGGTGCTAPPAALWSVLAGGIQQDQEKGVAPGAAHSKGPLTEARNADTGLSHKPLRNMRHIS